MNRDQGGIQPKQHLQAFVFTISNQSSGKQSSPVTSRGQGDSLMTALDEDWNFDSK